MNTTLISAFPGTGKTHFCQNTELNTIDSDSSKFDKSDFPGNYITHIKKNIDSVDIILISSHKKVREALVESDLPFILVYPTDNQKQVYMDRYRNRKSGISNEAFIELIFDNWDNWLLELKNQKHCAHVVLSNNQFITDIIGRIYHKYDFFGI